MLKSEAIKAKRTDRAQGAHQHLGTQPYATYYDILLDALSICTDWLNQITGPTPRPKMNVFYVTLALLCPENDRDAVPPSVSQASFLGALRRAASGAQITSSSPLNGLCY